MHLRGGWASGGGGVLVGRFPGPRSRMYGGAHPLSLSRSTSCLASFSFKAVPWYGEACVLFGSAVDAVASCRTAQKEGFGGAGTNTLCLCVLVFLFLSWVLSKLPPRSGRPGPQPMCRWCRCCPFPSSRWNGMEPRDDGSFAFVVTRLPPNLSLQASQSITPRHPVRPHPLLTPNATPPINAPVLSFTTARGPTSWRCS